MKPVRVLVTGAGSGVGQGIIKSLKICDHNLTIISADISLFNSALYVTDEAVIIPKVEAKGSLKNIIKIINKHNIDVVMIGSEFDLMFFSKNKEKIQKQTNAVVIVSDPNTVKIADDKWLTAEFLRNNGLPYAESFVSDKIGSVVEKAKTWGFPVMVKARSGTSSRGVYVVNSLEELVDRWNKVKHAMLQRVIDVPSSELGNEYTCSIFKTLQGEILGPFYARRTLRGGTSWNIEVISFNELDSLMMKIGNNLDFEGSLNVQLLIIENYFHLIFHLALVFHQNQYNL